MRQPPYPSKIKLSRIRHYSDLRRYSDRGILYYYYRHCDYTHQVQATRPFRCRPSTRPTRPVCLWLQIGRARCRRTARNKCPRSVWPRTLCARRPTNRSKIPSRSFSCKYHGDGRKNYITININIAIFFSCMTG